MVVDYDGASRHNLVTRHPSMLRTVILLLSKVGRMLCLALWLQDPRAGAWS